MLFLHSSKSKKSALAKLDIDFDVWLSGMPGPQLMRSEVKILCLHINFTDRNVPITRMINPKQISKSAGRID